MRQFPVYVNGFVNSPGPIMASATASVFDFIAAAGGIMKTGSQRNIVLHHADGTSLTIDLYDVLISRKSTDIRVTEGDSIFVPHIRPLAAVAGAVKRPGIYEFKGEPTVEDLISLAGGLLSSPNQSAISVIRFSGNRRQLIDANSYGGSVESLSLRDGDLVRVDTVRDCVPNEVKISGDVMHPGSYSVEKVKTLGELINRAEVLRNTDLYYGQLYRTGPGGVEQNGTFSPRDILSGKSSIELEGGDEVVLYPFGENLSDLNFNTFPNTVTLEGDTKYPGMKLSDILGKQNFLVDTNVEYGVVVRQ